MTSAAESPESGTAAAAPPGPRIRYAGAVLYLILSLLLSVIGCAATLSLLILGTVLIVTPLGLWVIAAAVGCARLFGALHRRVIRFLFREDVEAPETRKESGPLGWRRSMLLEPSGWMNVAYQLVRLPVAILQFIVGVGLWFYGALWVFWPLLRNWDDLYYTRPDGTVQRGLHVGSFYFDTLSKSFLLTAAGLLTVTIAAWTARKLALFDHLLFRTFLGPSGLTARVRQLERSRRQAVDESAATLRRIERNLHDGAQARLVALGMNLVVLKDSLSGDSADAAALARSRALVDAAQDTAKTAIAELRDLVRGIHPPALDEGLETALRTLLAQGPVPARLTCSLAVRPSAAIETMAYFCVAELVTNAAKHGGAGSGGAPGAPGTVAPVEVDVEVAGDWRRVLVRVTDDGAGGARIRPGGGLAGLADRVGTVDGTLSVVSPAGGPTVVTVELPSQL